MSDILWITGAAGFTGRHLIAEVRQRGDAVIVGIDVPGRVPAGVDLSLPLDLTDAAAVSRAAALHPPRWVVHLAGRMPPAAASDMWQANVGGTVGLLLGLRDGGCRGTRVVTIGSAAEYARGAPDPINELSPCGGGSAYGNTKIAQTLTALELGRRCDLAVVVARPFNLIGPGLPESLVAGALARQLVNVETGGTIAVGNIHTERDFVDVRDAVRAYWLLAGHTELTGVYNVASGVGVSIATLIDLMSRAADRTVKTEVDPARLRPDDPLRVVGDASSLMRATGWQPQIELADSIRDLLAGL